ncbi:hypothetical protein [Agromyces italicus]|uniref:hypothetical protein n=1 Tax=Agromyces italicus TaxID=279572 RepID=UPI0012F828CF|nr:hypothetical protein [Agromyces italicus]
MTQTESEHALSELMTSSREVLALPSEGWDQGYPLVPDPCILSNGDLGVDYVDLRTWTGDTGTEADTDALLERVREHWEAQGLTTSLDVREGNPGDEPYLFFTGRGGPVQNIRVSVIPGQVTLDGESICVVDADDLFPD